MHLITHKRKLWLMIFWLLGICIYVSARLSPQFAENVLALGVYRAYATCISFLTGLLPFSLAEIIVILLPAAVAALLVIMAVRLVLYKGKRLKILLNCTINLFCALGIILFMFMIGCGSNYYRYSFTYYSGLEIAESTDDELYRLCLSLAHRANEVRSELPEDDNGVFCLDMDTAALGDMSRDALRMLGNEYEVLSGYYPAPKRVLLSKGVSELNITGIFFPFTIEANVNTDIPDYSIASVMCHELSHLKGFMREDEANYISYLACTHSGSDVLCYSGLMQALILSGNALYDSNPELYYQVRALYSDGVRRDLAANSEYWSQFEDTFASEVGEVMNDTYLKANNQTDGTKSYGRMVDLLLAEFKKTDESSQ